MSDDRHARPTSSASPGTRSRSCSAIPTPAESRAALERLGARAWAAALDYLFDEAPRRPLGPETYPELRRGFFGPRGRPGPAPSLPAPSAALLAEFRERLAPHQFNAQHPRQFSYFTPPPLPISIVGELLAQWINQGVDIGPSSPTATLVEEEVVALAVRPRRLRRRGIRRPDLRRRDGQRDGPDRGPRHRPGAAPAASRSRLAGGRSRASASTRRTRPTSRSPGPWTSWASRPRRCASCPRTSASGSRRRPSAAAIAEDRAAGLVPWCIAAVAGSTNTGSVDDLAGLADLAEREDLWLHVDAAYGGASPSLGARGRPRAGARSRGHDHARPAQVVLPGLRHRRPARDAGATTCCRPSIARRSTTARPARRTSRCTGISTRSRGRAASAPSSSGSPGSRSAPRASAD